MSANRLLLPIAIPLFLVLVVAAILSVQFAADERNEQGWVVHTYQVIDQARRVLADAVDAETSQRGFIITQDRTYLRPYQMSRAPIERDLKSFFALTKDNPKQQARAAEMRSLVAGRFKAMSDSMAAAASGAKASPAQIIAMNAGRQNMDRLRGVVAAVISDEEALLGARIEARRNAERSEIWVALGGSTLAFAVLIAIAFILMRNNIELAQSEAARARQASMLQATLDNVRDGIAVFDAEGCLRAFNRTFFQLMDFPDRLAQPDSPLSEFSAIDTARKQPILSSPPTPDSAPEQGYQRIELNGLELDVYRAAVPSGGFLVAVMDVTARVRAESGLRLAQKMEAVGQLTGGVAHDFNNLLQIVSANLDLIAADVRGNPRSAERLQNAIGAVDRGSRLTSQLLAFARKQALEPRSTNLGRLVHDITDLLRRTLGERIEVEAMVAGGLWNTLVDQAQVENAILNLAINARDAMADGGKLTIEVANAFLDDSYAVEHPEVTPGQYVMLAVSDTGGGMPPDVIARAFDPFFTTKPEGRGTGLGLSQVYGFIKQSGGHIKIYSEVGSGTTVKLYLPRSRKPQEEGNPIATSQPVEGGNETILVVEDDAGVRAAVVDMLTELGYAVLRADNAEQALVILASGAPIDLLFTDVVMPGPITTRELARRAQALHPKILVLYTSGYTQNAIVHNGKLDEGVMLISKPYRKDELARKLRTMLPGPRRALESAPVQPAAPPQASVSRASTNGEGRRKRALVVEDVALIRMTTVDMLDEIGIEAVEAANADDALALLRKDEDIDILLTDIGLPGMNGHQLVEEARRLRPGIRVVLASGYSTPKDAPGVADTRMLMKPFDIAQLRNVLDA